MSRAGRTAGPAGKINSKEDFGNQGSWAARMEGQDTP